MDHTVITGGAGFIGSHLCEALLARGHRVTCVDNFCTGSRSNVQHLLSDRHFVLMEHDVVQPFEVPAPVHQVLHFASPASPPTFAELALEILKVNSLGTLNALELARKHKATFMLASTSEVYGDPERHPQTEDYRGNVSTTGPRAAYDESKRFAETATTVYSRRFGLDTRIARIFNTYGPRMRIEDGRAIPAFFAAAVRNEPLPIHGDGSQTRSLCYVDDEVEGLLRLLTGDHPGPINIGNPEEVTMLELANRVQDAVGNHPGVTHLPRPEDDPKVRRPDTTLAQELLGWKAATPLDEGLRRTAPWFQEHVLR